ncbi:MAG: ATP-binding cassette domain-containing protein [Leeuwenhoekiella sp.]
MNKLLEVSNVNKHYGKFQALQDISIDVPKGCVFGLLGPNGAGKTTLIRIINQITYPDTGTVFFDGSELKQDHIAQIGYMPEERGLYKSMKVGEQVIYLARLKGLDLATAKEKSAYWFDRLGMNGWWNKKIQELSKGQAQKVQFIVTVLHNPKLLIFDEPFSGFDPINANLIKDEILQLRDDGATVIFSTHRMESVEEMCDHIALIHRSQKILDGNLAEIKRQYRSNTFEVGLETQNDTFEELQELKMRVESISSENWDINYAHFKTIHENDLKLRISLPENVSVNFLLQELTQAGQLNHLKEVIPSVNEIFIKATKDS